MSIQRQLYLERMKKLIEMDPKKHVKKNPENGMFCVYDSKGKKVKEFKSKEDAEKYATDNHDALMKEDVEEVDELKKSTIMNYKDKAKAQITRDKYGDFGKVTNKTNKRAKGVDKATKKLVARQYDEEIDEVIQQYDHDNTGQKVGYTNKKLSGDQVSKLRKKYPQGSVEKDNDGNHVVYIGQYKKKNEQVDEMMPHGMNLSVKSIEKTPSMIAYRKKVADDHKKRMAKLKKERGGSDKQPAVTTTENYEARKIMRKMGVQGVITPKGEIKVPMRDRKRLDSELKKNKIKNYTMSNESFELSEADKVMINELFLFITNDAQLYRQRITPLIKNYQRKMKKGIFDQEMAVKGFLYAVNDGIKKYNKEFGAGSMKLSKQEKEAVATKLLDYYQEELAGG